MLAGTHYTPYFVEVSCYCIARYKRRDAVADYLLDKGAKLDIHTAAFLSDLAGVKAFLKRNRKLLHEGHPQYELGRSEKSGQVFYLAPAPWATPLCYALRGGDLQTVEYLIGRGARIKGNEKALFIAADKDVEKMRLLLEHGADASKAPQVYSDEGELFDLVSSHGVKTSRRAVSDELVYLCRGDRGGNPEEVERLLKLGADVSFQDHKGKTALHRAAKAGFLEPMRILIDQGAPLEIEDNAGETPLFDAVRSTIKAVERKREAVKMLIKSGADPGHRNHRDETPLSVARKGRRAGAKSVVRILEQG